MRDLGGASGGTIGPEAVWGPDGEVYVAERTRHEVRVIRWLPDSGTTTTVVTLHGDPNAVRLLPG